jgi:hypothetical protein
MKKEGWWRDARRGMGWRKRTKKEEKKKEQKFNARETA